MFSIYFYTLVVALCSFSTFKLKFHIIFMILFVYLEQAKTKKELRTASKEPDRHVLRSGCQAGNGSLIILVNPRWQ